MDLPEKTVFDSTDSWTLGIMILQLMMPLFYPEQKLLLNRQNYSEILRQTQLEESQRDLLSGLLTHNNRNRMTLQQSLLHPYFFDMITGHTGLQFDFEQSFKVTLNKIKRIRMVIKTPRENFVQNKIVSISNKFNSMSKSSMKKSSSRGRRSQLLKSR
jgi:serine/threonine protein kinase